jgi:signal transduction histidine kinase
VNSILETIKTDEDSEAECLLSVKGGESIELFVVTKPFSYEGDKFVFFTAKDISGVKRKNALEKIFFHDLMNLASSVYSVIDLIKESGTEDMSEDMLGLLHKTCENMIKEINDYRILSLAEKEELSVSLQRVPVARFIKEVISLYSTMASQKNIEIIFKSETDDSFYTDVSLSGRVLGNMLKNAIEASKKSENISVWTENTEEGTMLHVQNKSIIPEDIKTQIFKRTFTTKMTGTGLGTYSMKLIMQKYLKGDISFVSQEGLGTIFSAKFPSKETYMSQK